MCCQPVKCSCTYYFMRIHLLTSNFQTYLCLNNSVRCLTNYCFGLTFLHGKFISYRMHCKYINRIVGHKNFSDKWVSGADSVRTTNVPDHANSDQHVHAMNPHRREQPQAESVRVASYNTIVWSLNTMSEDEWRRLRAKFDIAYFLATKQLAYRQDL